MQLSDLKNWSKRYNTHYQFTRETTEEEAFSIPIDECRPSYNLIPSKTANILIDEDILRRLQTLMEREIKEMSNEWKLKFLYLATRDWIQFSPPNATEVKSSDFIQAIFENTDDSECQKNWELIECNINDLLFGSSGSSQYSGTVTFIGFVEFELRFGFLNQIAKSVFEISYNVNGDDGFHNFTPTNACCSDELFEYILDPSPPSSPSIISPCYAPWFLPSVDLNTSTNYMNQKRIHWLVKMSSNYKNCFTLIKRGSGPNKFMGTYIIFDPLASDKQTLLSEAKGSYIKAPDWKTMICKFNLKFPSMQGYPVERMTLMRVTADIMINDEDETDNGENNEIDFPIF
ncbi:hypothetical protein GPJ56_007813 [Histomonas meleagridis]|uniref:uncharacterized protein n=1 Tax=Histomonas meleagridis TaxID=135588 RepID=UPI0035594C16|nr:hypothetical protein GPJ56_007813 [Histomonas meleagridis]KAH0798708.1 hypothetical protein GO595_008573 [Histomonas meleagridis]